MNLDDQFDTVDAAIDRVQDKLGGCARAHVLARAAIVGGAAALLVVLTMATAYRTPTIVFGAFTAVIGGLVGLGANRSTRLELEDELVRLEGQKARLIDKAARENGWRDLTATVH